MKMVLGTLPRMIVMSAIVATLALLPVGGLLALACYLLFGVPLASFVTFGHAINAVEGVVAWWGIMLVPAIAYSAYMMPWGEPTRF